MTPQQIASLGPALSKFLRPLNGCFTECRLLDHFDIYCRGLLSDLSRKSVEPIALAAGSTVRALQVFLSHGDWDHERLRDLLQQRVVQQHAPPPGHPSAHWQPATNNWQLLKIPRRFRSVFPPLNRILIRATYCK